MSKTFKSDEFGDLQVPDNFAELSKEEQQAILQKAILIKNKNVVPMSNLKYAQGLVDQGVQGLTIGSSDEIGGAFSELVNLPKTIFTDQEFGDSFKRRVDKKRKDYKEFQNQYPGAALSANIVGSAAPIAASALLAPFTGGTSVGATTAATGARLVPLAAKTKNVLDSSRLLAGGIVKPGATLPQRTLEGLKMGTTQGLFGGAAYNESDSDTILGTAKDKASDSIIGGAAGATIGTVIPPLLTGGKKVVYDPLSKLFTRVTSGSPIFTKNELKAIKDIGDAFSRDEIDANTVIKQLEENISADKLEGIAPVDILVDYGGEAVRRRLRSMNITNPGSRISDTLTERGSGSVEGKATDMIEGNTSNLQSNRIAKSVDGASEKTIETKGINLADGIEEIEKAAQKELTPLYNKAYAKNKAVDNLELYQYLDQPILQRAYTQAKKEFAEKLSGDKRSPIDIPDFKNLFIREKGEIVGVTKNLPLEFLDLIKRAADSKTFNLKTSSVGSEKITEAAAINRQKIANNFRDLLKGSVDGDEYVAVLNNASDRFSLIKAYELAPKLQKKSIKPEVFETAFKGLKNEVERDAFRLGVFKEITEQINALGDNTDLSKKLLDSPNVRNKINMLFVGNEEAKEVFLRRLIRESKIAKTAQTVLGGSNTAEKTADAGRLTALTDFIVGVRDPGSSAGLRGQEATASRVRDAIFDPEGKQRNALLDVYLTQDPNRQRKILEAMTQTQRDEYINNLLQNTANRSVIRSSVPQGIELLNDLLK
jgi:hypothetical protein